VKFIAALLGGACFYVAGLVRTDAPILSLTFCLCAASLVWLGARREPPA